ncbi:uncharacterized protein EI97DRAFT_460464 [Westerdykella ornata]|uniref:Uncharacterized protein n=1 Tax=Westerdykella ornata TaxID=318751 RepID=A0A6A6JCS0_WESOR|nr:uncharacterized protein EI97DRAFT_460464 [Westerdykella ornata]KAF2274067.1 hypothetical protein EI97DRAFT_460464 [Westerdykella ornata]
MPHATKTTIGPPDASLLFSGKELQRYFIWHREAYPFPFAHQNRGRLPTATQYHDFQQWQRKRREQELGLRDVSTMYSDLEKRITCRLSHPREAPLPRHRVARLCKHVLHPITSQSKIKRIERCPSCLVDIHLAYMAVLTNTREELKEIAEWDESWSEKYAQSCDAWNAGKLAAINMIYKLEEDARLESHWRDTHPTDDVFDAMSAAAAVDKYWSSFGMADVLYVRRARAPVRHSPRYEPGEYALPISDRDCDTSSNDEEEEAHGRKGNLAEGEDVDEYKKADVMKDDEMDKYNTDAEIEDRERDDTDDNRADDSESDDLDTGDNTDVECNETDDYCDQGDRTSVRR